MRTRSSMIASGLIGMLALLGCATSTLAQPKILDFRATAKPSIAMPMVR